MTLRLLLLVPAVCAVNAYGQSASATPRSETADEFLRRRKTAGAIYTMKEDILALRRDVEAQEILRDEVKALQTEIDTLKTKPVGP
jgi:DNA phosphorothioation-dependent restriction protein DptG